MISIFSFVLIFYADNNNLEYFRDTPEANIVNQSKTNLELVTESANRTANDATKSLDEGFSVANVGSFLFNAFIGIGQALVVIPLTVYGIVIALPAQTLGIPPILLAPIPIMLIIYIIFKRKEAVR